MGHNPTSAYMSFGLMLISDFEIERVGRYKALTRQIKEALEPQYVWIKSDWLDFGSQTTHDLYNAQPIWVHHDTFTSGTPLNNGTITIAGSDGSGTYWYDMAAAATTPGSVVTTTSLSTVEED